MLELTRTELTAADVLVIQQDECVKKSLSNLLRQPDDALAGYPDPGFIDRQGHA